MNKTVILLCILIALTQVASCAQAEISPFQTISASNLDNLELGYAVPGSCLFGGFSSDGRWLASDNMYVQNNVVYDLMSGQRLFTASGALYDSPDGHWLAMAPGALYSYPDFTRLFQLSAEYVRFSPNSKYLFVAAVGLYRVETGELILSSSGGEAAFSPGSSFIVIANDGLYRLDTLEKLASYPIEHAFLFPSIFSPDEKWVVKNDGLYHLPSMDRKWSFPKTSDSGFTFSPDSHFLAADDLGVFVVETGEQLISTISLDSAFDAASTRVVLSDGIYSLETGDQLVPLRATTVGFSPSERFVTSEAGLFDAKTGERINLGNNSFGIFFADDKFWIGQGGVYSIDGKQTVAVTSIYGIYPGINRQSTLITYAHFDYLRRNKDRPGTGSSCLIYGIAGNDWPYRSGIVFTDADIDVYASPADSIPVDQAGGEIIVYARANGNWLKILRDSQDEVFGWIRSEDVRPVFMPEGIPVESE